MRRCVGYIHIEGFYAAQERKDGREGPFAVVEGDVVRDADALARVAGALPSVSLRIARRLCADLIVVPYDPRRYASPARRWMRLCLRHAPWLEPLSPYVASLDLAGHPDSEAAMRALHGEVSEDGLQVRAALTGNKLAARPAAMVPDPLGGPVAVVPRGAEAAFLAPHPLTLLWPLDAKVLARLERLEYGSMAEVAAASHLVPARPRRNPRCMLPVGNLRNSPCGAWLAADQHRNIFRHHHRILFFFLTSLAIMYMTVEQRGFPSTALAKARMRYASQCVRTEEYIACHLGGSFRDTPS